MIITTYNNLTFSRKQTFPKFISLIYNKRFFEVGSFEIHLKEDVPETNDIIKFQGFSGIVKKIVVNDNETVVYGYDLKYLFSQRIFEEDLTYTSKTPEYILLDICNKYLNTSSRAIQGITIPSNSGSGTAIDYTFTKGNNVSDAITTFCKENDIGYDFDFDETNIIFKVVKSKTNSDVIFDKRLHNINEFEYTNSQMNVCNTVYYSEDETIKTDGTSTGINRIEGYTDNKDDVDSYLTEHSEEETLSCSPVTYYKYGTDYVLGDYVTVNYKDLTTTKEITAVEAVFEYGKETVTPTFGTEKQNPLKKILRGV